MDVIHITDVYDAYPTNADDKSVDNHDYDNDTG